MPEHVILRYTAGRHVGTYRILLSMATASRSATLLSSAVRLFKYTCGHRLWKPLPTFTSRFRTSWKAFLRLCDCVWLKLCFENLSQTPSCCFTSLLSARTRKRGPAAVTSRCFWPPERYKTFFFLSNASANLVLIVCFVI